MLLQRIITALILIPLVVAGIFYLPTPSLALILGAIVLLAGWEWSRLAGLQSSGARLLYVTAVGLMLAATWFSMQRFSSTASLLATVATGWWLLVALALVRYRPAHASTLLQSRLARILYGFLVLVPAWAALLLVHGNGNDGPALVLFLMVLIWVADSGAYFSGRRWGRNKLAPAISPGKTREGVYGALVGAVLCGIALHWLKPALGGVPVLALFCLLLALVSVIGDLFESLLKRWAGLKDSSHILPGHGGILDRIDSLTAAAPLFLTGLLLLGEGR